MTLKLPKPPPPPPRRPQPPTLSRQPPTQNISESPAANSLITFLCLLTQTNEQARFDFNGNVLTGSEGIPEYVGLHHHGDEPDRAGYTLEELFLLSRSNFLQQRVLAINTLAKIIEKVLECCRVFVER
jgi:hypothetical protein